MTVANPVVIVCHVCTYMGCSRQCGSWTVSPCAPWRARAHQSASVKNDSKKMSLVPSASRLLTASITASTLSLWLAWMGCTSRLFTRRPGTNAHSCWSVASSVALQKSCRRWCGGGGVSARGGGSMRDALFYPWWCGNGPCTEAPTRHPAPTLLLVLPPAGCSPPSTHTPTPLLPRIPVKHLYAACLRVSRGEAPAPCMLSPPSCKASWPVRTRPPRPAPSAGGWARPGGYGAKAPAGVIAIRVAVHTSEARRARTNVGCVQKGCHAV